MSKILLVEDNLALARGYSLRLNSFGYDVIHADSIAKAVSCASKRKPDLSIVDINLPDGTGFMFANQINSNPNLEEIPVIFMTASSSEQFRDAATLYGPVAYLEKPIRAEDLINAIAACHYYTLTKSEVTTSINH